MASAAAAIVTVPIARGLHAVPRRIRVLTVDGNELVQEGLVATINRQADMTVIAAASTGGEAIEDVRRYRPDVVTLDLLLPDIPGEKLAERILTEFPRTRIVAITSAQGYVQARRAMDAGVHAYLSKALPLCELVRAIRQVQAGERIVPGPVASETEDLDCPLTRREIEVLQLAAWGNNNQQIAAQLSIAGGTARMHMKQILRKLGAHDRAHAVTIAVLHGILRLRDWKDSRDAHRRVTYV
jgi:DNA-binding NarL/FixJ family response regulator